MALRINGGPTNAGSRRPLKEPQVADWRCTCGHLNPRYATRCLTLGCNQHREGRVAA